MNSRTLIERSARRASVLTLLATLIGLGALFVPSAALAEGDSVMITSPANGSTIRLYSATNLTVADGDLVVTFTATGGPTTCSLDGQAPIACTSPVAFPHVTAGPHSVTVTEGAAVATSTFDVQVFMLAEAPIGDRFPPDVTARWHVGSRRTSVRMLKVIELPRRTRVRLTCSGTGCPRSSYTTTTRGTLDLTGFLSGRRLRPGARVNIVVRSRASGSFTFLYTMRRGARPTVVIS